MSASVSFAEDKASTDQAEHSTTVDNEDDKHYITDQNDDDDYNDDDDEEEWYSDDFVPTAGSSSVNKQTSNANNFSHAVANSVSKMQDLETHKRTLTQGRDDRATSEQVMDPRTRMILFKLLSRNFFSSIDGCLSTGKEANVYYAKAGSSNNSTDAKPLQEYAVKIYKTSILVFKDRDKYVTGEYRWKNGYSKSNPRKMVAVWAEKELRNYKRIHQAGIPCPKPVFLKSHVLVMEFLGNNSWPSPRLKDAQLNEKRLREAYVQSVTILRLMFQRCKLVHGDFSEYNLLWHLSQIYVIDVSQSVESDHPRALEFLRQDCSNINDFFRKTLPVMTVRQLFDFVTKEVPTDDPTSEDELLDLYMAKVQESEAALATQSIDDQRQAVQQEKVEEAVFMSSFLPRSLHQLAEYDIQKVEEGQVEDLYAEAVATLKGTDADTDAVIDAIQLNNDSDESSGGSSSDDSDHDSDDERFVKPVLTPEERHELDEAKKAERKAHKKTVKEERSEKRQTKIKKKDKKRAIKKSKAGNRKTK